MAFGARQFRIRIAGVVLAAGLCLLGPTAAADTWRGELSRGGSIIVDPDTHRALREDGGSTRPLWDGVHHLQDGSTVIVRDGVAIPTEDMYEAWSGGRPPEALYQERWCTQLVRKTCGFDNACANQAACLEARTLLGDAERERRELALLGRPGASTTAPVPTEGRCRQALVDPAFAACASLTAGPSHSRCRDLVVRVCGADDACATSPACDAARQLQALETEERLMVEDPSGLTGTGSQCIEAMHNAYFAPCGAP